MPTLVLKSYAKLNLYLEVVRKRPDGYHELRTIFEKISLADQIKLTKRSDGEIKIISTSSELPSDYTKNLAYKSAKLIKDNFCLKCGVDINIIKHIPVGSGMGGGSSNAATVLCGLNRLWKINLKEEELAKLALKIGSDVPFFIYQDSFAYAQGRGEKIKKLPKLTGKKFWHILVVPRVFVSTADIYQSWDNIKSFALTKRKTDIRILLSALENKDYSLLSRYLYNSLMPVTENNFPQVSKIIEVMRQEGVGASLMSGSGPTVFGIVSSKNKAMSIAAKMRSKDASWRVFLARTV